MTEPAPHHRSPYRLLVAILALAGMAATFVPWLHTPNQGDINGWMGKGTLSLGMFAVVLFVVCLPSHSWLFVSGLGGAATAWAVLFVLTAAELMEKAPAEGHFGPGPFLAGVCGVLIFIAAGVAAVAGE